MKPLVKNKNLLLGILFIITGTIWLLNNAGLLQEYSLNQFFKWYYILLAVGVYSLLTNSNLTGGVILIAVSMFFILPRQFGLHPDWSIIIPLILILLGFVIIWSKNRIGKFKKADQPENIHIIDEAHILSGTEKFIHSDKFQGGKITCILGGAEIDLTSSELAEGTHTLDIFALFGGVSLMVPPDWTIKTEISALLGGFADERPAGPDVIDESKVLVIKGFVMLGGGEIKSYRGKKK
jgi:predicted membrane protein